jgi:hypothetical protein
MFEKVLSQKAKELLLRFKPGDFPSGSYLGGGTAIALQIGHRKSVDLDFFAPTEFDEGQWLQKLEEDFGFKLMQRDWQTLVGEAGGVKISLMGYKYPLINDLVNFYQMPIASLPDLAAMKLDAILGRGTKRDMIDIYCLAQKYSLAGLFEFYDKKYKSLEEREIMIKKALVYFVEADDDEMPDMIAQIDWNTVKEWLTAQVRNS